MNQHAFISIQHLQEIVTDILAPVYIAQRNDSDFAKDITEKYDKINKDHEKTIEEIKLLKRSYNQFADINKKMA